jgi:arylsulfatase A-like enzyme
MTALSAAGPAWVPRTRRRFIVLLAVVIVATSAAALIARRDIAHASSSCLESASKCNVLFVETDDQSIDTMINPVTGAARITFMPLLGQQLNTESGWYTFTHARAQDPLCGPSRWGQLVGQTSIHHGLSCNDPTISCNSSAYKQTIDKTYLAALKDAGYWNSWVGKFVNWYPCPSQVTSGVYQVPRGVDDWHAYKGDIVAFNGNYNLIESDTGANAHKTSVPRVGSDADYGPYVLRDKTLSAIDRCAAQAEPTPCLWQFNTSAGHAPGTPPNNYNAKKVLPMPAHYPSYNEGCPGAVDPSIADKASFERSFVACDPKKVSKRNRYQRPLQAEDTSLAAIVARLKSTGLYDNTIIVFTSDHGYSDNENNHISKQSPYDPSMRVPLLIRVPGATGGRIDALTYLPDLTATLYDIAGTSPLVAPDGESLLPLMRGDVANIHPDGILGSHLTVLGGGTNVGNLFDTKPFNVLFSECVGVSSPPETTTIPDTTTAPEETTDTAAPSVSSPPDCYALIRWKNGEEELYDLTTDPYEMTNLLPNATTGYAGVAGWDASNPTVEALEASLDAHIAAGA